MKKLYKDNAYDSNEWEFNNVKTGESIYKKNCLFIERVSTGFVSFSSKSYLYLDLERLNGLRKKGIKPNELGFLILMCENLMFNHNISMYDERQPHSAKSLGMQIGITQQAAGRNLRRLVEIGAVSKGTIKEMKHLGIVYTVNPYFLRIGKKFRDSIGQLFDDLVPKQ